MVQFFAKTKVFKLVFMVFVFGIGFFTLGANIYIPFHYAAVMPRTPQPEAGRIYRMTAQYGTVVYVNKEELDRRDFVEQVLTPICGGAMLFFVLLAARLGWFGKRSESITG